MLCAHWDSRPYADHDPDPTIHNTPIDGANDGASGVGVLMESARQFSMQHPAIGIDIVFFDLEDYGPHRMSNASNNNWGLGSQYWSKNPHKAIYRARYGILLDMVGVKGCYLPDGRLFDGVCPFKSEKSMEYAANLGYGIISRRSMAVILPMIIIL